MMRLSKFARAALTATGLAVCACAATAIPTSRPALADQFIPIGDGWQTYINDRFGMRFDYPASVFIPGPPPENGDGRAFSSPDATLLIYASHNVLGDTPASMKQQMVTLPEYQDVTYSPSGTDWLVLSGYRGDTIFYEKYFFRDDVISGFSMEFPSVQKPFYAPIIERMEDSFRAGHPY